MNLKTQKRKGGTVVNKLSLAITYLILSVFTFLIGYPLFWMVMQSLKELPEMFQDAWAMPQAWAWENFREAIEMSNLDTYIFNSLYVTIVTVLCVLILASTASYAFSKMNFRGKNLIFYIFILSIMLPVPIIPLYMVIANLNLMNTHWALILTYTTGGLPLSIFMLKSFFDGIPKEIEEAAIIDGCPNYRLYAGIIIPLAKPGLATVTILQFMGAWNEFFHALIFIRTRSLRTIPIGIQAFFRDGSTEWPLLFAALTITIVPVFIVYIIMQKQFVEGLTAGATKL